MKVRERRSDRRLSVEGRVRLLTRSRPRGPTLVGPLLDVSAGGLRFETGAHPLLPAGTTVEVAIDLSSCSHPEHPGLVRLSGRGQVLRLKPAEEGGRVETAVRFTEPLRMREPLVGVFLL